MSTLLVVVFATNAVCVVGGTILGWNARAVLSDWLAVARTASSEHAAEVDATPTHLRLLAPERAGQTRVEE